MLYISFSLSITILIKIVYIKRQKLNIIVDMLLLILKIEVTTYFYSLHQLTNIVDAFNHVFLSFQQFFFLYK